MRERGDRASERATLQDWRSERLTLQDWRSVDWRAERAWPGSEEMRSARGGGDWCARWKDGSISRKGRLSWSKTVPFFSPSIPGLVRQNSRTLECRFYPLPPWPLLFLAVDATIAGPPWPARTTEPWASPATRASPSGGTAGPGHSRSFRTRIAVNLCYSTAQTARCLTSRHRSTAPPPSHR